MLDTDYENYLFFCVENTDAPEQSLVCQYLGRPPRARREHRLRAAQAPSPEGGPPGSCQERAARC